MSNRIASLRNWPFLATGFFVLAAILLLLMRPGGMGGTGISSGEGGVGGTGINTGYIGRIDRFGSIYVNGQRITYPADMAVSFNTRIGTVDELQIGQIVEVIARETINGIQQAVSIRVRYAVIGEVEAISSDNIIVFGKKISLPLGLTAPAIGKMVAVSGFTKPDGVIVASRIDIDSSQKPGIYTQENQPFADKVQKLSLSGYASQVGQNVLLYGYKLSGPEPISADGTLTTVTGTIVSGQLQVEALEQEPVSEPVVRAPAILQPADKTKLPTPEPRPTTPANSQKTKAPIPDRTERPRQMRPQTPVRAPALTNDHNPRGANSETITPAEANQIPMPEQIMEPEEAEIDEVDDTNESTAQAQSHEDMQLEESNQTNDHSESMTERQQSGAQTDDGAMGSRDNVVPEITTRPQAAPTTRPQTQERPNRPERVQRPDRPERPTRPERPNRPERPVRPSRPGG